MTRREYLSLIGAGAALPGAAAAQDGAGKSSEATCPRPWEDGLYDSGDGTIGVTQGVVGMRGLRADHIFRFNEVSARRVLVSGPPAGKPVGLPAIADGD